MEQVKLFRFYGQTDNNTEIYQYPFKIVSDKVYYFNYGKDPDSGDVYWALDKNGRLNDPNDAEIWWPDADLISATDVDEVARHRLIEFILEIS